MRFLALPPRGNFIHITNYQTVCFEDAGVTFKPVSEAIHFYSMVTGVPDLQDTTSRREFLRRVREMEEIGLGLLPGYSLTLEDVMQHAGYSSSHNPVNRRAWNTKLAEIRHEQAKRLNQPVCVVSYKDSVYVGDNEGHAVSQVMDRLDSHIGQNGFLYPGDPGRKNPTQRILWWNGLPGHETHQIRVFTNVPVNR